MVAVGSTAIHAHRLLFEAIPSLANDEVKLSPGKAMKYHRFLCRYRETQQRDFQFGTN